MLGPAKSTQSALPLAVHVGRLQRRNRQIDQTRQRATEVLGVGHAVRLARRGGEGDVVAQLCRRPVARRRSDNWPASAGRPDSMKAITSAISAPGSGGLARRRRRWSWSCAASTSSSWSGADREGSVCSASPPTPCEQPPTSTDAAISTAIRIPARLAGR